MASFEEQYQQKGMASQRRYPNESLIAFLAQHYFSIPREARQDIRILELGCGSGANLWMLAHEGFSVTGLDFSPTGLSYCREMLNNWHVDAALTLGDMTDLPFDDAEFDVIVDVVSMQHLNFQQHQQALHEIWRTLKPGGRFFSYHLGAASTAFSAIEAKKIDAITLENIPAGYPLAGNGQTAFLSEEQYLMLTSSAAFSEIVIEHQIRSYAALNSQVEYLLLSARKSNATV